MTHYLDPRGIDLDWFAVDQDGHVGYFTSAGFGSVPYAVLLDDYDEDHDGYALLAYLRAVPPTSEPVYDRAGLCGFLAGVDARLNRYSHQPATSYGPRVVFLTSLAAVQDHLDHGLARAVLAADGVAVWYASFTEQLHHQLHSSAPPHSVAPRRAGRSRWGTGQRPVPADQPRAGHIDICQGCCAGGADSEWEVAARHGIYAYDWPSRLTSTQEYRRQVLPHSLRWCTHSRRSFVRKENGFALLRSALRTRPICGRRNTSCVPPPH